MSKEKHQCSKEIWRDYREGRCSRNGVNFEDGKWWCRQHTPSILKKKREDEQAKYDKDWKEKQARWKEADRVNKIKDKLYAAYLDGRIPKDIIQEEDNE